MWMFLLVDSLFTVIRRGHCERKVICDRSHLEYHTTEEKKKALREMNRKDSKNKELREKIKLKYIRRESMPQTPDMCLDADRPKEFHSDELQTFTDEVTSVHPSYLELFSSFIFIFCHPSVSKVTVSLSAGGHTRVAQEDA